MKQCHGREVFGQWHPDSSCWWMTSQDSSLSGVSAVRGVGGAHVNTQVCMPVGMFEDARD